MHTLLLFLALDAGQKEATGLLYIVIWDGKERVNYNQTVFFRTIEVQVINERMDGLINQKNLVVQRQFIKKCRMHVKLLVS